MRRVLLAVAAAGAVWYVAIGGRELKEAHIYDAYNAYWTAFSNNDDKAACAMFDKDFTATIKTRTPGGTVVEHVTQADACAGIAKTYALKQKMEAAAGEPLFFNTEYTIDQIQIMPDKKLARVQMHSEIRIGTEQRLFLTIREESSDVFERSLGKTYASASESVVTVF